MSTLREESGQQSAVEGEREREREATICTSYEATEAMPEYKL